MDKIIYESRQHTSNLDLEESSDIVWDVLTVPLENLLDNVYLSSWTKGQYPCYKTILDQWVK